MSEEFRLDHFLFYDVENSDAGATVSLQGQFDEEPIKANVRFLDLFANPVKKIHGDVTCPIIDSKAHLSFHVISQEPEPTRVVLLRNQFRTQQILIGNAQALLAPAKKEPEGGSDKLDHYKCYRVLEGKAVEAEVFLADQFTKRSTVVLDPVLFAVPVKKEHDGRFFEIHNKEDHLTLYRIRPFMVEEKRLTADQFGERGLKFFRAVLLGVPSTKIEWGKA